MGPTVSGWAFVAAQGALALALVLTPTGDDWTNPAWVRGAAVILGIAGLAVVVVAGLRLGPALTPTPVPRQSASLAVTGPYRWVRHPIYTGVLAVVAAVTIRSRSWVGVALAGVILGFFHLKAAWEERRLAERYRDYPAYAAATPRFVPRPWSSRPFRPRS